MNTPAKRTLAQFRHDLRIYAGLAGARYDPAAVDPVLEALEDAWTGSVVGVRTTTHPVPEREIDARVQFPGRAADLVERLHATGLLVDIGHPMEELLGAMLRELRVQAAVDLCAGRGLTKVWLVLGDTIPVDRMLAFPGIPAAARAHAGHLRRYGGEVGMVALDFAARTMNLYSQVLAPEAIGTGDITTMLAELGLVPATAAELALFTGTFNVYRTFSWTSDRLQRISFPRRVSAETFPRGLHPVLDAFADGAPMRGDDRRFTVYVAYGPADRYYKIQAEYAAAHLGAFPGGTAPPVH